MKLPGNEEQQKKVAVGAFVAVFVGFLYYQLAGAGILPGFGPDTPAVSAPVAAPVVAAVPVAGKKSAGSGVAAKVGTTSGAFDPTLRMDAMLVTEGLVYTGNGRNIFSADSAPVQVAMVAPIAPPRIVAPPPPMPVAPAGPPPPPPIDLKFFGTATVGQGGRQAFLLHGDDVFLASEGDIVVRKYRIVKISANSIEVEDMPNNNKQTLPLLAQN